MPAWIVSIALLLLQAVLVRANDSLLGTERVVFQTSHGDIHFGLYHSIAPKTAAHILKVVQLGCFNTNHFFRVHPGFVAQTMDTINGRSLPMNDIQRTEAAKTVPLEVDPAVKHTAGVLSMGRTDDPNSGTDSFSILLGDSPHLDMQYTIFGKVTQGMEVVRKIEKVETTTSGIFVMPKERITIQSTFVYYLRPSGEIALSLCEMCESRLQQLQERFHAQELALEKTRKRLLP